MLKFSYCAFPIDLRILIFYFCAPEFFFLRVEYFLNRTMFNNDVPPEFMHCFNVTDEIPEDEAMEVEEENQFDLYQQSTLEWHQWNPNEPEKSSKQPEPKLMRLTDLDMYEKVNIKINKKPSEAIKKLVVVDPVVKKEPNSTTKAKANFRGPCRSYTPIQIQELLDLVIEQGMSARKAGLTVGIVVRTA
jgi:hypothetical protein